MAQKPTTELGTELKDTLARSCTKAEIAKDTEDKIRLTDIPHSGAHMLPGGMSTLKVLGNHWEDWNIEYVDNDDTVMCGSRSDKDVVITRIA